MHRRGWKAGITTNTIEVASKVIRANIIAKQKRRTDHVETRQEHPAI
jgi:hypothetical protein